MATAGSVGCPRGGVAVPDILPPSSKHTLSFCLCYALLPGRDMVYCVSLCRDAAVGLSFFIANIKLDWRFAGRNIQ